MPKRNFRIVRFVYPLTGICEYRNQTLSSQDENLDEAEKQLLVNFDAHRS